MEIFYIFSKQKKQEWGLFMEHQIENFLVFDKKDGKHFVILRYVSNTTSC